MSQDEITKLFRYMMRVEKKLDKQFENMATKDDVSRVYNRLDSIERQLEISEVERLAIGHHVDRLDKWVHGMADKIGYKLSA